ncbi:MAG: Fe-S cluster assembly ATPase SufC [Phycisphaerales bacterium]|nr:Fe-S cluster assembly ATPase SufC [Phycisphaerales bacterium]
MLDKKTSMALLEIKNLHARVAAPGGRDILKGVNLTINAGEVHAIMGKNGSGKSTLAQVLAGREAYEVTEGEVLYKGQNLLELSAEERAREGVFLAFQYPVEIPGVSTSYFLKAAVNAVRKHRGEKELDAAAFLKLVKDKMKLLKMEPSFMNRAINEGFSGGEKKRNEIFQMAVMNPALALMDETDSGLDVDALKTVAEGAASLRRPDNAILVVTHYERLLQYIVPDVVHVMMNGRLVMNGGKDLAIKVDTQGYDWVEKEVGQLV